MKQKEMLAIFDGMATLDMPKPSKLIEFVLKISAEKETLVLDSFAGCSTTAHAVLNMNKTDDGNCKSILAEMMDYADSIAAERVKRVFDGYGSGKQAVEGAGGDCTFYDLGQALLLPDGNVNEDVDLAIVREYVWYIETKMLLTEAANENPYCLGSNNNTGYYFTTLGYELLSTIKEKSEGYLTYADLCTIPDDEMMLYNITFERITRDIA